MCLEIKPTEEFYAHNFTKDRLNTKCKDCIRNYSKQWYNKKMSSDSFRKARALKEKKKRLIQNNWNTL